MIKLYHVPMTRSTRVRWLLEELDLPYQLEKMEFSPPSGGFYSQKTPMGKFPVIEDEGVVISESGAILEYSVERYADGRLAPSEKANSEAGTSMKGPATIATTA